MYLVMAALRAKCTHFWENQKKSCKDPEVVHKLSSLRTRKKANVFATQWAKGNNVKVKSKNQIMLSQDKKFEFYSKCNGKVLNGGF